MTERRYGHPPVGLVVVIAGVVLLAPLIATTPPGITLGATLPPLCAAALLMFLRRRRHMPVVHLVALAWGAIGAALAAGAVNDALLGWAGSLVGEPRARALVPAVGGPVVEELAKAAGLAAILVLHPAALCDVTDGIVCGALVGLGFTLTENVGYLTLAAVQGGAAGLGRALWVRAVLGGFTHALFTATVGAGLAWGRGRARIAAASVAFVAAVAQHVVWNVLPSREITDMLCNPIAAGGPCRDHPETSSLLVAIPLVVTAGVAPGALALWALVRSRRRAALRRRRCVE